jgi:hypothetical protein
MLDSDFSRHWQFFEKSVVSKQFPSDTAWNHRRLQYTATPLWEFNNIPVVRGVEGGTMHTLQIWLHPPAIRRTSKKIVLITTCHALPYPRAASVKSQWWDTTLLQKCSVQCYTARHAPGVLMLWSWQRRFFRLCFQYIINTHSTFIRQHYERT